MKEFRLHDSIEYFQIREKWKMVNSAIDTGKPLHTAVCDTIHNVLTQITRENFFLVHLVANVKENTFVESRIEILKSLIRPETVEARLTNFRNRLIKDFSLACAVSNYSFAQHILLIDSETKEQKKTKGPFDNMDDPRLKSAHMLQNKASDAFRNGKTTEALKLYLEADEKYPFDYGLHYRIALIYFFELGMHEEALCYFQKASRNSREKDKDVFVKSQVFIGLIFRLEAAVTGQKPLFDEAIKSVSQAFEVDSENNFVRYAMIQCILGKSAGEHSDEATEMVRDLLKKEKFFVFQMICDRAMDLYLFDLKRLIDKYINDFSSSTVVHFKKIEESLENIEDDESYLTSRTRLEELRSEYKIIVRMIGFKNFFDVSEAYSSTLKLVEDIGDSFRDIAKNKRFNELKVFVEGLISSYSTETETAGRNYKKILHDQKKTTEDLESLNINYPPAVFVEGELKPGWMGGRYFMMLKLYSGRFISIIAVLIYFATFIIAKIELTRRRTSR